MGEGEKDPKGLDQHEYGAKLDARKPDASLLLMFGYALRAVSEVGTFGASKYARGGWQGVDDGELRYTAALMRHLLDEHYEVLDSDSGLLHAAHAAWNALARLELIIRKEKEFQDATQPQQQLRADVSGHTEAASFLRGSN